MLGSPRRDTLLMDFKPLNSETIVEECTKCRKKLSVRQASQDLCICRPEQESITLIVKEDSTEAIPGQKLTPLDETLLVDTHRKPEDEPPPLPPEGYELICKIGSGTFCTAYQANRIGVPTELVIKVLKPEYSKNPRMAKRFLLEVEKAAAIANPGLAPIYQLGSLACGQPFFVTDFFADNLASTIEREGFLSPGEAADVFLQICEGLCAAHEAGILHRSLKPKDIVISHLGGSSLVKVTDLGVARVTPAQGNPAPYLIPDTVYGDARYMSPEQCRGERLDERSDIYSLGCIMYETLSGKPPFSGGSPMHTAVKQLEKKPVLLSERFAELEVSSEFEALVMKCLQKDPSQRYQTVHELQAELQALKDNAKLTLAGGQQKKSAKQGLSVARRSYQEAVLVLIMILTISGLASYLVQKSIRETSAPASAPTSSDEHPQTPDSSSDLSTVSTSSGPTDSSVSDAAITNTSDGSTSDQGSETAKPNANATSPPLVPHLSGQLSTFVIRDLGGHQLFTARATSLRQAIERAVKRHVKLWNADLVRAQLSGANLEGAELRGAQLSGADLSYANCKNANFEKTQLSGVNLYNSNFSNANLCDTILNEADMRMSTLENADVERAVLRDDNFDDANLQNADFEGSLIYQVDLTEAKTTGIKGFSPQNRFAGKSETYRLYNNQSSKVIFTTKSQSLKEAVEEAVRQKVSLKNVNLAGADLFLADLKGADLQGADLRGALLVQADLTGADLRKVKAQGTQLDSAELQTAKLDNADFTGARFFNTDLRNVSSRAVNFNGAELSGANVSQMNVEGANLKNADLEDWQFSQIVGKFKTSSDNNERVTHKPTSYPQANRPHNQ
jgi:uncharacterized protein YjbI with pentapeptide repeats